MSWTNRQRTVWEAKSIFEAYETHVNTVKTNDNVEKKHFPSANQAQAKKVPKE